MTLNILSLLTIDNTNYKRPVYNQTWVDRLYKSFCRNLSIPFNFYCFTNDLDQNNVDYKLIPLEHRSWGWWNKFEMFQKNMFTGPCLYCDIDNLICKNITFDITKLSSDKLLLPKEPYKNILNCAVMYWNTDLSFLYDEYVNKKEFMIKNYSYATKTQPATGDQGYLADFHRDKIDIFDNHLPDGFFGWKHHKVETQIKDPSILIFTSSEKPTNNMHLDIVKNNWID